MDFFLPKQESLLGKMTPVMLEDDSRDAVAGSSQEITGL